MPQLLLFCLLVFVVRVLDVTIATTRLIFMVKGKITISALIAFGESFIWFMLVREALTHTGEGAVFVGIAFAGGFAVGTLIGGIVSGKIITGSMTFMVITDKVATANIDKDIREAGYAVTIIDARGQDEDTQRHMMFIEVDKKKAANLKSLIKSLDPRAFIVINESHSVQNGFLPR